MTARPRNLSEDEFAALVANRDRDAIDAAVPRGGQPSQEARLANKVKSASFPFRSKLEAAWANHLNILKAIPQRDGGIQGWAYEPLNFRLPGKKNYYKIDFCAWDERGVVFYEIKGHNLSDDRSLVKMKTAAGLTPWARFVLVKRLKGHWEERVMT